VQAALSAARANQVMGSQVSITPSDVVFTGDEMKVTVYRTAARSNPLSTLVAKYFGVDAMDVSATASAGVSGANAETCVKPFTIPDRWIERQTPPWDPTDTFDLYDKRGRPLPDPDVYIPVGQPGYTGFNAERDKGLLLTLKSSNSTKVASSFYFALAIDGSNGANDYRWNIANCNTTIMKIGQRLTAEPGNMVGPTSDGIATLYDRDEQAYWNTTTNRVVSSRNPSPRVGVIPLYDPMIYESGKRNGRVADLVCANFLGVFIEGFYNADVTGRVTPTLGLLAPGETPPEGAYPKVVRLIK
jgi:hypothetical protein